MGQEDLVRISLSPGRRPRKRRTLEEHLAVGFPALYYRVAALAIRLPRRSRLRKALLRRGLVLGYAAYGRRDDDVSLLPFDPEIEAHQAETSGVPIGADLERSWRGHAGFLRMWDQWDEAFTDARIEPNELLDLGDRLVVLVTYVARGRTSGAEVRQPAGQLLTFRRGRVVRWEQWWDWDKTLDAVGIRRQAARATALG